MLILDISITPTGQLLIISAMSGLHQCLCRQSQIDENKIVQEPAAIG